MKPIFNHNIGVIKKPARFLDGIKIKNICCGVRYSPFNILRCSGADTTIDNPDIDRLTTVILIIARAFGLAALFVVHSNIKCRLVAWTLSRKNVPS